MVAKKTPAGAKAPAKKAAEKTAAKKAAPAKSEKAIERLLDKAVEKPTRANVEAALAGASVSRVSGEGLLFHVCASGPGALPLVISMLDAGVDPNGPAMPRYWGHYPLQGLFEAQDDFPDDEALAIAQRLLAAGADPDLVDGKGNTALADALVADSPVFEVLWERSSATGRVAALLAAIANAGQFGLGGSEPERLARARNLLPRIDDPDAAGPSGLTPLMQVVISANAKLLPDVLARSKEPAKGLATELTLDVPRAVPARGGVHPSLKLPRGLTARGIGLRLQEMIAKEAKKDGKNNASFIAKQRASHLVLLEEVLAVLAERQIPEGEPSEADKVLPPFLAPLRDILIAASIASGSDKTKVTLAIDSVDWGDLGPVGYFKAAVKRLEGMLAYRPTHKPSGEGRFFVALCGPEKEIDDVENRYEREEEGDAAGVVWIDPHDYPGPSSKIVKKALDSGAVLTSVGDDLLLAVQTSEAEFRRDGSLEKPAGLKLLVVGPEESKEVARDFTAFIVRAAADCGLT